MSKCSFLAVLAVMFLIANTQAKAQYQKDRGPDTRIRVCAQHTCTPSAHRVAMTHQVSHKKKTP
jgi:hypothetical protein